MDFRLAILASSHPDDSTSYPQKITTSRYNRSESCCLPSGNRRHCQYKAISFQISSHFDTDSESKKTITNLSNLILVDNVDRAGGALTYPVEMATIL